MGGSSVLGSHLEGMFACGFSYYFILQEVCLWVNVEAEEILLYFGGIEGKSVLKEADADHEKDTVLAGSIAIA